MVNVRRDVIERWHLVNLAQEGQRLTIFRCGYSMTEVGQGSTGEDHQTPSARVCVECVWSVVCGVCGVWCVWSVVWCVWSVVTVCVVCGECVECGECVGVW